MIRSRNLVAVLVAATFCLLLVMPAYGGDGCCASKAKVKSACADKSSTDASSKSGCAKPCSKPCSKPCGSMHGSAAAGGKMCKLTFGVACMSGGVSAKAVNEAIKLVEGVQSVAVDQKSGVVDVEFDAKMVGSADVIQAIEKAGYTAQIGSYSDKELAEFANGKGSAKAKSSSP